MGSDRVSNVGHYHPPRYTCCFCLLDIPDGKEGIMNCPSCNARIVLWEDTVPEFSTRPAEKDDEDED